MSGIDRRPLRPAPLEWLYLAVGLALVVRYAWLLDDAFVYFRYVDNLLRLDVGLVYNAGEYVEGYSSPLYSLLLIGLRSTGLDWVSIVLVVGCGAFALLWVQLVALSRRLGPSRMVVNLPLALVAFGYATTSFFTSGLETPLAHAVAPAVALALLAPAGFAVELAVACAPLVRPELALALVGTVAWAAWRDRAVPWRLLALAAAVNGAWLAFRVGYYADLFPNTYYLKDDTQILQGLRYVADLLWASPLLPIAIGLGGLVVLAARRGDASRAAPRPPGIAARCVMAAVAVAVAAYVVKVGGAALHYWYLAFPFTLLLCALSGLAEWSLARLALDRRRAPVWLSAIAVALATGACHPRQLGSHPLLGPVQVASIGVVGDAAYHRQHPTLRAHSVRGADRRRDWTRDAAHLERSGYDAIETGTWCRAHWGRPRSRIVHGFGLTEPILARVRTAELKPGHKPALRALAEDLAAMRRGDVPGVGLARRALRRGDAPAWIARNLASIETIERKMYNRHDWIENLRLAFTRVPRIEIGPQR